MTTKLKARQTITRDTLGTLYTGGPNPELDNLLRSINAEVTLPLAMTASVPADRIVNVSGTVVINPETGRRHTISPINNIIPNFNGGTVTLPATNNNNITNSTNLSVTLLNIPSGNFIKVGICLNNSGEFEITLGASGVTIDAATNPPVPPNTHSIGYFIAENVGGNIQNVTDDRIYQYIEGSIGAGSVEAPVGSIVAWLGGYFTNASNGGFTNVLGNSVANANLYIGENWRVCDGTIPNDPDSPIWNNGTRRVPNLTDSRFIRGGTAGAASGSAAATFSGTAVARELWFLDSSVSWAHTHSGPSHTHSTPDHQHVWATVISGDDFSRRLDSWVSNGTQQPILQPFTAGSGGGSGDDDSFKVSANYSPANMFTQPGSGAGTTGSAGTGNTGGMSANATKNPRDSFAAAGNYTPAGTISGVTPTYLTAFYIIRIK